MNTTLIIECIQVVQQAILSNEDQIESLDRAIGDGDHFINVRRGCEVVMAMSDELRSEMPAQAFNKIGMKLLSTIGGASGPLISSLFLSMGKALTGIEQPDRQQFALAFVAGVDAIKQRGKADVGEKTMLDVLIPAARLLQKLTAENASIESVCKQLSEEATINMLSTKNMIATKGRAHFLGERALGHIDPGCKTCEVVIAAICRHVVDKEST
jgi:phosphoenolpyruvate---glycerone phosphotransferase subunit DhaL